MSGVRRQPLRRTVAAAGGSAAVDARVVAPSGGGGIGSEAAGPLTDPLARRSWPVRRGTPEGQLTTRHRARWAFDSRVWSRVNWGCRTDVNERGTTMLCSDVPDRSSAYS